MNIESRIIPYYERFVSGSGKNQIEYDATRELCQPTADRRMLNENWVPFSYTFPFYPPVSYNDVVCAAIISGDADSARWPRNERGERPNHGREKM
jgi:hypothetical protein